MTKHLYLFSSTDHDEPRPDEECLTESFQRYCEAAQKAQKSKAIEDGIAAGHAWRDFMGLFCPTDRSPQ